MTKWYVDPTYDPLQDLHDCKTDIAMLKNNILQVAAAYNDQSDTIKQLMEQNQKLVKMMVILNDHIEELLENK
jgi:hypothetical protein